MLRYLSTDIICSQKRKVFRECSSRKTVSFEEQIISKDKYPSIFSKSNGGYCVYYPQNIFCNTHSFENWGTSLGYSPVLAREYSVTWQVKTNCTQANIFEVFSIYKPLLQLVCQLIMSAAERLSEKWIFGQEARLRGQMWNFEDNLSA